MEASLPATQGAMANMQADLSVQALEEDLARSLAQALYMEQSAIDVEIPFVDMGLDSVISAEWVQSINKQYASNLAASCVYDYPTILQLASFLKKEGLRHPQMPPSMSTLSLDDVLVEVYQRNLDPNEAEKLLPQMFL